MRTLLSIILFSMLFLPSLISITLTILTKPGLSVLIPIPFHDPSVPGAHDPHVHSAETETERLERERADVERQREEAANRTAYENSQKYFHEPASHEIGADDRLGHYDTRFFTRQLGEAEKRASQVHMVRAFLDTFRERDIEAWLAHGTLLGWYWNTQVLPWDWDIDVQVSEATLGWLAAHLNNTRHAYASDLSTEHAAHAAGPARLDEPVTRTYLLDVNPHAAQRDNGDGFNIIDARWISVADGLYIDITGLSEQDPEKAPGELSCKNFHSYQRRHLWPLREAEFEGVRAHVPFAYRKVLADEYGVEAMVRLEWEGHRWDDEAMQWIKMTAAELRRSEAAKRRANATTAT